MIPGPVKVESLIPIFDFPFENLEIPAHKKTAKKSKKCEISEESHIQYGGSENDRRVPAD